MSDLEFVNDVLKKDKYMFQVKKYLDFSFLSLNDRRTNNQL